MDDSRFDALAKGLAATSPRRQLVRGFGLIGLTIGLGATDPPAGFAKRKKRKKKLAPQTGCSPDCRDRSCGPDGCGGSCGSCQANEACFQGRCVCAPACGGRECGLDGCGGLCGLCPVSGQVCTEGGRCACPAALPEVCGGACVARCVLPLVRNPVDCACCLQNGFPYSSSKSECCSQEAENGLCVGLAAGVGCVFDALCATHNCVAGMCSDCESFQDACKAESHTCGRGGYCLRSAGGQTRCGVQPQIPGVFYCGDCTTDAECQQRHGGDGKTYFCAIDTGPHCGCPADKPGFCVVSKEPT
jgi:hypothetical protein